MTGFAFAVGAVYLLAACLFVIGLHLMRSPGTAHRGNLLSAAGMALAVVATVVEVAHAGTATAVGWASLVAGLLIGGTLGLLGAQRVKMTGIPQLVSLFNAVGGGAAAAIGFIGFLDAGNARLPVVEGVPIVLDVIVGSVSLTGSLIAAGKLQGLVPSKPLQFPGARVLNILAAVLFLVFGALVLLQSGNVLLLGGVLVAALGFGVLMVLPIGGADAPVVVSLLNAFTGLAVAMAGFGIGNQVMIVAGALVGSAGTILTLQMAQAMNRSVMAIIAGGFGTGDAQHAVASGGDALEGVHQISAEDVAMQLAYAHRVMIVPGFGLAAAQAQQDVAQLASQLAAHGIDVSYAIHPVAGRMPGHMNVLLAEVNVPYSQLLQLDEANAAFPSCDVALVLGANDVINPAARRAGTAISGMPILDVDRAASVVIIKRSMSPGYAGIPNELFTDPKTGMFFVDAKKGVDEILAALKQYLPAGTRP